MYNPTLQRNDPETKIEHEVTPKWTMSVKDLPPDRTLGLFLVTPTNREPFQIKNRKRRVVDALNLDDLYSTSTVRNGDIVFRLRGDENLFAETKTLAQGRKFYPLNRTVKFLGPVVAGKGGK